MANKCFLLIAGHVFIARKWEIPPYLMLLFSPEDRRNRKTNRSGATQEISYFSTVSRVKARLDKIGFKLDSLRNAIKKLPLVEDYVIDFVIPDFLNTRKNLEDFLQWWDKGTQTLPEGIGSLLDELDEDFRYSPIGHLFLVRLLCEYLDDQTEIILDPSEVVEIWEDYGPSRTDLHKRVLGEFANELEASSLFSQLLIMSLDDVALLGVIHRLDENDLINYVLVPLLDEMGFRPVISTRFHGPGELGRDILPFFKENEFGFREYYAVQAKAASIHAHAGRKGNVNEVLDQARTALSTTFFDQTDNSKKKIDHLLIVVSHNVSRDARMQIEDLIEEKREIMLIDDKMLIKLLKSHERILRQVILRFP